MKTRKNADFILVFKQSLNLWNYRRITEKVDLEKDNLKEVITIIDQIIIS